MIENHGRITLGSRVRFSSNWAPVQLVSGKGGVISIGDGVYVNFGTLISANRSVTIGSNVMIGNNCIVADTDIPGIDVRIDDRSREVRAVEIGENAWLAARVVVLPGTRIGAGAVVAAGSVVAGEVPPGCVAAGIPARIIRTAR